MRKGPPLTAEDVEGPWHDSDFESGLIDRCHKYWTTPVTELPNNILATYLRQKIALSLMIPEAEKRIAAGFTDKTELYEIELAKAVQIAEAQ